MNEHQENYEEPVTITDKRRIDPETGTVRDSQSVPETEAASAATASDSDTAETTNVAENEAGKLESKISELTSDLQRAHADFENFRRRTERDRSGIIDHAKASVISELLVILDDIDRADSHGDLKSGPFLPIAEKLREKVKALGAEKFGEVGDPFDPAIHEAVQDEGSGSNSVIGTVYRHGYKYHDKVIRSAMVVVVDGAESASDSSSEQKEHAES